MPRPKKILSEDEQRKLDNRKRVRAILLRLLSHIDAFKINRIIETSILKSWAKKYSLEFLESLELPAFLKETDSLRPLTGDYGKKYIEKQWNAWVYKNQEVRAAAELGDKIGPDLEIDKTTKKTLKDFLN